MKDRIEQEKKDAHIVGMAPININISGVDTSSAYDVGMAVRNALMDSSIAVSAMG